jgi:membrane fusion protein, multidrug efflux system
MEAESNTAEPEPTDRPRVNRQKKKKRIIFSIVGILVIIAALGVIKFLQIRSMIDHGKKMVPPPETVTATTVQAASWATDLTAVGTLTAVQGVTVACELPGKVVKIAFEPGAFIHKGELLIGQDTSSEEAQLQGAEAQAELARSNLQRDIRMLAERIISQADYDAAEASWKQALAQASNIRAAIGKKTIRAPFSGRLGIRQANLGQMLREGDPIVTLQTMNPIYADFALPQQQLGQLRSGQPVRVTCDALPGLTSAGSITALNPLVDTETRNIRLQATLENPAEKLRPGMFVNVAVALPVRLQVLAIPATAVLYAPYGDSVFVIVDKKDDKDNKDAQEGKNGKGSKDKKSGKGGKGEKDGKGSQANKDGKVLRQQFVRLGEKRGDFVAINSGLKEGDLIVSTGVFKLRNGQSVLVDNKLAPPFKQAPTPENN